MSQDFQPGDYLIFQIESGYGLLRLLAIDGDGEDTIWHLAAFNELFLDVETADLALENPASLSVSSPHIALTNRAYESTQVARMKNEPLRDKDLELYHKWKKDPERQTSDRSIRLMLGLR